MLLSAVTLLLFPEWNRKFLITLIGHSSQDKADIGEASPTPEIRGDWSALKVPEVEGLSTDGNKYSF